MQTNNEKQKKLEEMSDDELIIHGLSLMHASLLKLFDIHAKEHKQYEEYYKELLKRKLVKKTSKY